MLLMWIGLAQAGEIEAWEITDFGNSGEMTGNSGWRAGYGDDPWYAYQGDAFSLTDDSVSQSNFRGYGNGDSTDNWLIRGDAIAQVSVEGVWSSQDDDAIGIVTNHNGKDSFYLLAYSEHSSPPPVYYTNDRAELMLIRVEGGEPEVLNRVRSEYAGGSNTLSLSIDDGILTASLNDDTFFVVEDPNPLGAGQTGLYAYNSGDDGGYNTTYCWFSEIRTSYVDEDDDGVADDTDNCEEIANPDQADWNDNGIGDACGDERPEDTGGDTSTPDTSDPGDTDIPGGLRGDIELEAASCGCSSSKQPTGLAGLAVMLTGLILSRRRSSS